MKCLSIRELLILIIRLLFDLRRASRKQAELIATKDEIIAEIRKDKRSRELNALGIASAEHFAKLLKNRIQRLYRTTP